MNSVISSDAITSHAVISFYRRNKIRTQLVHRGMYPTRIKKEPAPLPVTLTKGSVHVIAQRRFVEYLLFDKRAQAFIDWVKDTGNIFCQTLGNTVCCLL